MQHCFNVIEARRYEFAIICIQHHFKTMNQKSALIVKTIRQGVMISLSKDRQMGNILWGGTIASPLLRDAWRVWGFIGILLIASFSVVEPFPLKLFLLWIVMWGPGVLYVVYKGFGKEILFLSRGEFLIKKMLFGITLKNCHYEILELRNFRRGVFQWISGNGEPLKADGEIRTLHSHGELRFDCDTGTVSWGGGMSLHDANLLIRYLSDMKNVHWHSVEQILFGDGGDNAHYAPYTILQNPDVTTLTTPFVHLKQLIIYPTSYNFHQVERFLTYAVNYMKRSYLKNHVEVHVYGDPEKLHSNLRNSFATICKSIQFHALQLSHGDNCAYRG